MSDTLTIKNIKIYKTKTLDWESIKGTIKRGFIEWEELKDRNGKVFEIKPFMKGDDLPKYAELYYQKLVDELKEAINERIKRTNS